MLRSSVFGDVELSKNPDRDKNSYIVYGISFDLPRTFSSSSGESGKNIMMFAADMS